MHTDLLRIALQRRVYGKGKAPSTRCAERAFPVSLLSSRHGLVTLCQTLSRGERIRKISIPITRRSIGDC